MMHPLTEGSTVEEAGCSPLACVRETRKASYHKHLYLEVVNPKARRYYRNGSIDTLSLTLSHTHTYSTRERVCVRVRVSVRHCHLSGTNIQSVSTFTIDFSSRYQNDRMTIGRTP